MKISKRKITASSSSIKIPAPFDKYYELVSDAEIEDYTGMPARPTPCEEADGYNIKSFSYAIPKPKYEDALADNGLDILELVTSDWDSDKLMLAMVVNDRVVPVSISEVENCIEDNDDLYDRDAVMQAIKDEFGIDDYDAYTIYDWYNEEGALDDFDSVFDFIDYISDDIYDMLDACDDQIQADRIREAIESSTKVTKKSVSGSVDTGLSYWYLTKHGLGPGMMPGDVKLLDCIEDGWDTYILLDKMLTTDELNYYDIKEKTPPQELLACDKIQAGRDSNDVRKLAEDDKSIHYVVGQDEEEDPDWIVRYDLSYLDKPGAWEAEERRRIAREIADEEDYYDRMHGEGEYDDIEGSTNENSDDDDSGLNDDSNEDDEFFDQPEQEFKSNKTAVNGIQGKLPAVFKKASIPNGALVLDYGGGTPESEAVAQAYLDQFDAREMLFDPFNQTKEHNSNVVKELRANGGADVAVCSNVLNVIKEQAVRLDVISKINKLMKNGATAFITVYEGGDKDKGVGKATQNGQSYQNNLKLESYLDEVKSVFPDAVKKGSVIVAPKTSSAKSVQSSTNVSAIDINQLQSDIVAGCEEYLTSPEGGFLPSGSVKEDKYDMTADEIYVVDIHDNRDEGCIVVEVRAELGYDGMMNMSEVLDDIIRNYDPDAYFDMVEPGIMEAYICDNSINSSTAVTGGPYDRWNDEMMSAYDSSMINPPDEDDSYYDEEEKPDDVVVDYDFDFVVNVFEDGYWEQSSEDEDNSDEIITDEFGRLSVEQVEEDAAELLNWSIPANPGKYRIQGHFHIEYKSFINDYGDYEFSCKMDKSSLSNVRITNAGSIEEDETTDIETSTDVVEAAMSADDVEYAILNDKPFELDAFNDYTGIDSDSDIKASQVEVNDIIEITSADVVDYGTVVKVLRINDPDDIAQNTFSFDYVFRCEIVELPDSSSTSSDKVGDEVTLWYDSNEYVGKLIPV